MRLRLWEVTARRRLVLGVLVVIVLFYTIPVAAVQALLQVGFTVTLLGMQPACGKYVSWHLCGCLHNESNCVAEPGLVLALDVVKTLLLVLGENASVAVLSIHHHTSRQLQNEFARVASRSARRSKQP